MKGIIYNQGVGGAGSNEIIQEQYTTDTSNWNKSVAFCWLNPPTVDIGNGYCIYSSYNQNGTGGGSIYQQNNDGTLTYKNSMPAPTWSYGYGYQVFDYMYDDYLLFTVKPSSTINGVSYICTGKYDKANNTTTFCQQSSTTYGDFVLAVKYYKNNIGIAVVSNGTIKTFKLNPASVGSTITEISSTGCSFSGMGWGPYNRCTIRISGNYVYVSHYQTQYNYRGTMIYTINDAGNLTLVNSSYNGSTFFNIEPLQNEDKFICITNPQLSGNFTLDIKYGNMTAYASSPTLSAPSGYSIYTKWCSVIDDNTYMVFARLQNSTPVYIYYWKIKRDGTTLTIESSGFIGNTTSGAGITNVLWSSVVNGKLYLGFQTLNNINSIDKHTYNSTGLSVSGAGSYTKIDGTTVSSGTFTTSLETDSDGKLTIDGTATTGYLESYYLNS